MECFRGVAESTAGVYEKMPEEARPSKAERVDTAMRQLHE
jgi:hypothetical protein